MQSRGYSPVTVCGLLLAVASLVSEHRVSGRWASVAVARGFQKTSIVVVAQGLSCPHGMWDVSAPGMELMFPALQGGFLIHWTTRKPLEAPLNQRFPK